MEPHGSAFWGLTTLLGVGVRVLLPPSTIPLYYVYWRGQDWEGVAREGREEPRYKRVTSQVRAPPPLESKVCPGPEQMFLLLRLRLCFHGNQLPSPGLQARELCLQPPDEGTLLQGSGGKKGAPQLIFSVSVRVVGAPYKPSCPQSPKTDLEAILGHWGQAELPPFSPKVSPIPNSHT